MRQDDRLESRSHMQSVPHAEEPFNGRFVLLEPRRPRDGRPRPSRDSTVPDLAGASLAKREPSSREAREFEFQSGESRATGSLWLLT